MAGAIAEACPPEKTAAILKTASADRSRDCDGSFAGHTHARNPLPQLRFAAYIFKKYGDSTRPPIAH
jgi:hypothetical protein